MEYILPKSKFSYSQWDLWNKSPKSYRKRYYYEGSYKLNTPAIKLGREIARKLENKDPELRHIKQYSNPEHMIEYELLGITIISYIDTFNPKTNKFLEYKTGKHAWTEKKVNKHKQLDFYSYMIQKVHGEVCDECELHWIESTDKLRTRSIPPRLTGKVKVFKREITQEERDEIEESIIKAIKEIHDDYQQWRNNN